MVSPECAAGAAVPVEAAKALRAVGAAAVEVGEISRDAPAQQAAKQEAESWPDFERLASAVKDFVHRAPGMSEADVWGSFECMKEVLEDFMHQAGALQGLLQEALACRQDLCDAEGGSKGWSGAEVLFMQRACSEECFLQEARVGIRSWSKAAVKQQALVVKRFMQKGVFLKV